MIVLAKGYFAFIHQPIGYGELRYLKYISQWQELGRNGVRGFGPEDRTNAK